MSRLLFLRDQLTCTTRENHHSRRKTMPLLLRFDYLSFDGHASRRMVEPHRLVHARGCWFLVGWDVPRKDWRAFRADWIRLRTPNGRASWLARIRMAT